MQITLISAHAGDSVPGVELAECDGQPWIEILDLPQVKKFFATQGYGPDNPDELMYAVEGDEEIPTGFPTLTVSTALVAQEKRALEVDKILHQNPRFVELEKRRHEAGETLDAAERAEDEARNAYDEINEAYHQLIRDIFH